MKKTALFCVTVLLTVSTAQAQQSQVAAIRLPNGGYTCPSGYHGPIRTSPGGAWVCVR